MGKSASAIRYASTLLCCYRRRRLLAAAAAACRRRSRRWLLHRRNCKHFAAAAAAAACLLCGGSAAAAAVLVHRKKRPVRIRPKNVVALHKKMIQRGAKVKEAAERIGSGAPDGQDVWDRGKTMAENYAVSLMAPREIALLMVLRLLSVVPVPALTVCCCCCCWCCWMLLDAAGCCWLMAGARPQPRAEQEAEHVHGRNDGRDTAAGDGTGRHRSG
jgi:hypothetical protein